MKKYLRNNMDVFQKVKWLKQLASEAIGVADDAVLRRMLGRLRRKGSLEIKKYGVLYFSQQELILDQVLKAHEVSPRSAYRWFCLIRAPKTILENAYEEELSQNELIRRCKGVLQKSPEDERLRQEIIQDIIKIIEVL